MNNALEQKKKMEKGERIELSYEQIGIKKLLSSNYYYWHDDN